MDYIFRKATPADAAKIEKLFSEMRKTIYGSDDAEGYEIGYLDKFFSGREDWICVAEQEQDVVAFLSMESYRDAGYLYLDDLSVAEGHRKNGIGTKLIRTAEEYAKAIGAEKIVLHVEKANQAASRFYSKLGYKEVALDGSRILMSKSVKSSANG